MIDRPRRPTPRSTQGWARRRAAPKRWTIGMILLWADAHRSRTRQWPTAKSGPVVDAPFDVSWSTIDDALARGLHGLPRCRGLLWLLHQRRGRPYQEKYAGPPLTIEQIKRWARSCHRRTGAWPTQHDGAVAERPDLTWALINGACLHGRHGLRPIGSLGRLLNRAFPGRRRRSRRPPLDVEQIFEWAKEHHARTGRWPYAASGRVRGAPGETWNSINSCLEAGLRGLPGGSSLSRFLRKRVGKSHSLKAPPLTIAQIRRWAESHRAKRGRWPSELSGRVLDAPQESWRAIDTALRDGYRGLPGGNSLKKLFKRRKGSPSNMRMPPLSISKILRWADAYRRRTGRWPTRDAGPIPETRPTTWRGVHTALAKGGRGLAGGTTLAILLMKRRGARNRLKLPPLSMRQVSNWIKSHHRRTGKWPLVNSGLIREAPGESWVGVDWSLRVGRRGLKGGSSLALVVRACMPQIDPDRRRNKLTIRDILLWARAHYRRNGAWPDRYAGRVVDAPREVWLRIDNALRTGKRGLAGGSSLKALFAGRRPAKPIRFWSRYRVGYSVPE